MENASYITPIEPGLKLPDRTPGLFQERSNYYAAILLAILTIWALKYFFENSTAHPRLDTIPTYRASNLKWILGAEELLKKSYNMFHNQAYQIYGPEGTQVLLPSKYISEAKLLPDHILDTEIETSETLQTKYTGFPVESEKRDTMINLLRIHIAAGNIAALSPHLKTELDHFVSEFPSCETWTPFRWQPFCLRAISRLGGYVFVGPSVSRQEEWTGISINFAMYVFIAGAKLQLFPQWARPVVQYGVSELGKIKRCISTAARCLEPLLVEKKLSIDAPSSSSPTKTTMLDAIVEELPEENRWDVQTHAELQLMMAAASIHTTGQILCECMYDLAVRPDLQEELRQEAYEVMERDEGWSKKDSTARMRKMDSFMREVQRFHGNMATFRRKVMKPVKFADGMHLPAGISIFCPQAAVSLDERFHANAEEFDPLRFYRLREEAHVEAAANRWQFTSPSDFNMHFGIGRHTCPGRFLASVGIKLVLAYFVLNYEVRLKPGSARPNSWTIVMTKSPDPNAELEFRKRVK